MALGILKAVLGRSWAVPEQSKGTVMEASLRVNNTKNNPLGRFQKLTFSQMS